MEKTNLIISYLHNTQISMKLDVTFKKEDVLHVDLCLIAESAG